MRSVPKIFVMVLVIFNAYLPSIAFGYNDETTHRIINISAAKQPRINLFLKNQIGFKDGKEEKINGNTVEWWVAEGGEKEDADFSSDGAGIRYRKHFHDPLTENWGDAGLWGVFDSALLWALFEDRVGYRNGFSWNSARSQEVGVGPSQVIDIMSDWW